MPMATEARVLLLGQWLSPAYPVGAFAYSHGLEAAAAAGWVSDGAELKAWLEDVLLSGAGRSDALLIAASWQATDRAALEEIDTIARAFAPSKERLFETDQQGRAFGTVTGAIWGRDLSGLSYPVALGAAAAHEDVHLNLTQQLYLQAFLSNLVAAGQRLLPVGQTEAQAILRRLTGLIPAVATDTQSGDLAELSSTAFLSDIASMQHETQHARIFRT